MTATVEKPEKAAKKSVKTKRLPKAHPFQKIRELSLKVMTGYTHDLDIDEEAIIDRLGMPFLHFTRATGTTIVFLRPYSDLPGPGQYEPYLFSTADRHHIVDGIESMSNYYRSKHQEQHGRCLMAHYFDGETIRKLSPDRAAEIGTAHCIRLRREIREEGGR